MNTTMDNLVIDEVATAEFQSETISDLRDNVEAFLTFSTPSDLIKLLAEII